ncbi:DUF4133 domain-containing protein [Mucilaginibacter daejeonensis]|uniref:DUF4133 domain-containing protein n=1 Tax=Mucilaginibacter daejeonensis TaxID=398049 RepID=UPI001D176BA0|nr:DUF4133 domain-containing protein [Mucilaginibacter daejeonensis]UEG54896.1 DUF4133 domain-containing protein [Mucilaginibacter daejeonensis]
MYAINKGINRPVEFKGLQAQYIMYLGIGLVLLLLLFTVLYLAGIKIYICLSVILGSGSALFYKVFQLSHKYGEHGLMKMAAKRQIPNYIKFSTRRIFYEKR